MEGIGQGQVADTPGVAVIDQFGIDEEAEMAKSRDLAQKMADRINHKEPAAE